MNIAEQKQFLRKQMMELRKSLSVEDKLRWDKKIAEQIYRHKTYQESEWLYCYASYKSEIDTYGIIKQALEDDKRVAVPKVLSKTEMEFYEITSIEQLVKGYQGIPEPKEGIPVRTDGLMLLPGLAFTRQGNRMGYGGGYYDRYLEKACNREGRMLYTIGLSYFFQIKENIPVEKEDWVLDAVVTEMLK